MQTRRAFQTLALGFVIAACSGPEKAPEPSAEPVTQATQPPVATQVPLVATPKPATTPPVASPPPTTLTKPAATPGPVATPPPTTAPPPPPPTAPPVDPAKVAAAVAAGDAAFAAGRLADAASAYGEALTLDPASSAAKRGRARTETTRLGQTRTFVPDLASSEGAEGKITKMDGFDSVAELNVKRAVKVLGRAELDGTPAHIKPGENYTVEIYLRNQDLKKKKSIKVANVNIHRIVNNKDSLVTVDWKPVDTRPKDRALVATVTGPWEDDVSSWILSVKLLSEGGDIYENRLVWK
jgi:hypothetical protein